MKKKNVYNYCSEEAEALAKKLKLKFFRTSVKSNFNVKEGLKIWGKCLLIRLVFDYLAEEYVKSHGTSNSGDNTTPKKDGNQPFAIPDNEPSKRRTDGKKKCKFF